MCNTFVSLSLARREAIIEVPLIKSQRDLLLKDQPRFRHVPHRDCDQFPPACSELVQLGLHILRVGKYLDDSVLKLFLLLCLRGERLSYEQQKSQCTKAHASDHPRY